MITRNFTPGSAPATLSPRNSGPAVPPEIKLMEYSEAGMEERIVASVAELPLACDDGKMRWIEMNGLGDVEALRALGEKYHLHPLALEDALNTGQRPKVDHYDGHLFLVALMVYRDDELRLCAEQVSMFVCPNMLITVQEEPLTDVFDPVRERVRNGGTGRIRRLKADYLAYALLDSIVDHLFPVLEAVGELIEDLEEEVLEHPTPECAHRLHALKRALSQLRRFVWPKRDLINALMHDNTGVITDDTKTFLRDCYDHTIQIMDFIESYRDVTSGLMDIYLSAVGIRTNEVMRVLTVISAIFIPLTFIAGVYGMNFAPGPPESRPYPLNMPELYLPHGYLGVMLFMALIAAVQIYIFHRKKWL